MIGGDTKLERATSALLDTAFVQAMHDGSVSREGYAGYLRLLAASQATIVRLLHRELRDEVAAALRETVARPLELLLADLDELRGEVPDVLRAMGSAADGAQQISRSGSAEPPLVGHLHALDIARRIGADVDAIDQTLALSGRSLAFIRDAAAVHSEPIADLLQALDPADRKEAERSAQELLTTFKRAFKKLEPVDPEDLGVHVLSLNPEAGSHPVTQDRRELQAAIVATDRALEVMPYVDERWGARGRRFTDSDGGYLAYLLGEEESFRASRIDWLGRLLAARGMPTSVLRVHLEILADELAAAMPEEADRFAPLHAEAARLDAALRDRIDEAARERLARDYSEAVSGDPTDEGALEIGRFLVDAACDEVAVHRKAVESVVSWVLDPARATGGTDQAVDALLREARTIAAD